ncbi:LysR family transcriptional regulator [Neptuniibacter sp.]|uniref:LysR family transcriptional regulator n=1 Tax=Neptuniibacter sp. TaxID=1962643 RepID=UPI0026271C2C|nr:LysR family transcriptional regulator [Neptuniibacter sp.]MCP4596453.1 LysR family transcriptional regulator [Neptuniibacter sp.]
MANLDDTVIFNKVAELCSYTQAGKQLNIPKATVSRRVRILEEQLGVKLINRDTRKLSLTEAGHYLYNSTHSLLTQVQEIENSTVSFQTHPAGELRITMPVEIGIRMLNEIICDFAKAHPQIQLDIHMTNDVVDIIREGFDVAIRGGSPKDSNLIARKIMSSRFHICCSPEYLREHPSPAHPFDLKQHQLIAFPYSSYQQLKLRKGQEEVNIHANSRISANSLDMLLKAAKKGLGIAILPTSVCSDAIRSGDLISLFNDWHGEDIGLYALYPDRVKTKKLELFIQYIEQRLSELEKGFV